jgi:hypothetical protein
MDTLFCSRNVFFEWWADWYTNGQGERKNLKPEDYLSIGEFARIVGITPNSLRVYDNRGIFSPATPELNLSYPIGGCFDSMEGFLAAPSRPARFFSHDPQGNETISAGLYLTGYTRGYYGQTNDLPRRMAAYAVRNGLTFAGPVYNTYLLDELSMTDTEQYLLRVSASVSEARRDTMSHIRHRSK